MVYKDPEQNRSRWLDEAAASAATPRVLIADDDAEMRRLLVRSLRADGYEVTECPNGVQLLDRLASFLLHQEPEDFDLIISDIRMPGLTGLEVLQGLTGCVWVPPIILITAFGDDETREFAVRAGAAAMFDKPFEINDLLAKVHEIVPRQSAPACLSPLKNNGTETRRLNGRCYSQVSRPGGGTKWF